MDTLRETLFTNKRIWARDWGPIFARNESGELYMLEPIYTRGGEDDQLQAVQPIAKHFGAKYMILPLKIEGGDLIHNGQIAFVSERVLRNLHSPVKIEAESSTYTCQYKTKEDIKNVLKSFLGFKEVFLVDKFPVKPSHVDYWLKFIDEKTILLGKLYSPLYRKVEKYNYLLNAIVDDFRQRQKIDPHTIPNFWHSEPLKDYWSKLTSRHQTITKNIDDQLRRDKIWLNYYLEKSPEAIDPNEPITIPTSHREFRYRLGEPEELKKLQAVHSLNINQRQAIIWTLESQRLRRNIRPILQTKDIKVIDIPYLLYEGEYFTGNFPVNSILTSDNTVIISDISPAHKNAILTLAPNYQNDVQAAYESAGLNPRLVPLGQLEYAGNGSVHCMTLLGPKF